MRQISRSTFTFMAFCSLGVAGVSVAQEIAPSPQEQIKQVTYAFFRSVNQRDSEPIELNVIGARDYFSGYPRDNPGGTIRNIRVFKTTIKDEGAAIISGRLWVVPSNGRPGKIFTFEHSLIKKNNVWNTETLLYNYIPKD